MKKKLVLMIILMTIIVVIEIIILLNEIKKIKEYNNIAEDIQVNSIGGNMINNTGDNTINNNIVNDTIDNNIVNNAVNNMTNDIGENTTNSMINNRINNVNNTTNNTVNNEEGEKNQNTSSSVKNNEIINQWNLKLVNYENSLPSDFEPKLSAIDNTRKFDSRAIGKLKQMLDDMKKDNVKNIWVQSSYRSIGQQKDVFNKKVNQYIKSGKSRKEAERLTLKTINKPGTSEHNLGLAVDFNYVNLDFEKTEAFIWLKENAEDYGFILRYPKEKEQITKVNYEPWHWRYVGQEHAKKINEKEMCLEEYIEYLKQT